MCECDCYTGRGKKKKMLTYPITIEGTRPMVSQWHDANGEGCSRHEPQKITKSFLHSKHNT